MRRAAWIAAALVLMSAAPAVASPLDAASSHAGLRAQRAFESSLVRKKGAAQSGVKAFVAGVQAKCPRVLESLSSSDTFASGAASQFGKEVGADLVLAAFASYRAPLATLERRIARLRWSSPAIGARLGRALDAETTVFSLMPSDLCADGAALVANGGRHFPPGAHAFLSTFQHEAERSGRLDVKQILLRYRQPGSDKKLVREIGRLEERADSWLGDVFAVEVPKLLNAVGLFV